MPAESNEEDFPRGGGSILSPLDLKQAREEAAAELRDAGILNVRKRRNDGNRDKGKQKKLKAALDTDDEDAGKDGEGYFLGRDMLSGKAPTFVNVLKFKALEVGYKLWGAVAEVNERDLVISLPGGLRGFVKAKEASDLLGEIFEEARRKKKKLKKEQKEQSAVGGQSDDEEQGMDTPILADYFKVGQLVSCTVTALGQGKGLGGKGEGKRIELSLRVGLINEGVTIDTVYEDMLLVGCVWSIEDHGYLVSFGVPHLSGFLLAKDMPGKGLGEKLKKGQLVLSVVKSIDKKRRTLGLKADAHTVAAAPVKEHDGLTLGSLQPGWLVNARVQTVLVDGLVLSFLTYFTGTVDRFHLDTELPGSNFSEKYTEGQRVRARILYVDPVAKRVALTLNPVLIAAEKPLSGTPVGTVFDNAVVRRLDPAVGLLAELPTKPTLCAGYAHISNLSDERVEKLEKKFKVGQKVRARVIGHRLMDMVANISLKASVVEQLFLSYADVIPGTVVSGEIVVVDTFGAIVQLADNIRALCPLSHMTEHAVSKPSSKFQVGATMKFRVLACDPTAKKVTVTRKKTMVSSKLMPITSYSEAVEGLVSHGYITGVKDFGCFVSFYGNVKGLAHRSELGLDADSKLDECFQEGQVVKCRVLRVDTTGEKISLSFITISTRGKNEDVAAVFKPGSIVAGKVVFMSEHSLYVDVKAGDATVKGVLPFEHVADHTALVEKFKEVLKVGVEFDQLLVLEHEQVEHGKHRFLLSAKPSLLRAAETLPSEVSQLKPESLLQGYIGNATDKGCFVRFLNRLTGLASPSQLADYFVSNPRDVFQAGQSVRAKVLQVKEDTERFSVCLKQSVCFSLDASYLHHYFTVDEKISELRSKEEGGSLEWSQNYPVGDVVQGQVQEIKEYGVIIQLKGHDDVVGFVNFYQAGGEVKVGEEVTGIVLDVSRGDGIVDLSLRQELVAAHMHEPTPIAKGSGKTKGRNSKVKPPRYSISSKVVLQQLVEGTIELVKDEYLVVSLPIYEHTIAFASIHDFNRRVSDPRKRFKEGNRIAGTVECLGEPSTGGRVLLLLSSSTPLPIVPNEKKHPKGKGATVSGKISAVHPLHADVDLDKGGRGRISVCEIQEGVGDGTNPLSKLNVGQAVDAIILGKAKGQKTEIIQELSLRGPFAREDKDKGASGRRKLTWDKLQLGEELVGYVQEVQDTSIEIGLTPWLSGRLSVLDSSNDPKQLENFKSRFVIGQPIRCRVADIKKDKKFLVFTLRGVEGGWNPRPLDSVTPTSNIGPMQVGDVVAGRIIRLLPTGGLSVLLGGQVQGRVCATDLSDRWTALSTEGFAERQYVRCVVLGLPSANTSAYQVSFRGSLVGSGGDSRLEDGSGEVVPVLKSVNDLQAGQEVQGYVKSCTHKGCFVALSRHIDARILLSELSSTFLEDPMAEFHPGKLVRGKVLTVDPRSQRVEMTLRRTGDKLNKSAAPRVEMPAQTGMSTQKLSSFKEGDILKGRVRRVENFGLFVEVDGMDRLTGMCHISEVSDKYIKDLSTLYQPGVRVRAMVKKVDLENLRLSLIMKESAFSKSENEKADEVLAETEQGEDAVIAGHIVEELAHKGDKERGLGLDEEQGGDDEEVKRNERVEKVKGKKKRKGEVVDKVMEEEKVKKKFVAEEAVVSNAVLDVAPLEISFEENELGLGEKGRDEEEEGEDKDEDGEQESKGKSKAKRDKKRAKEEREKAVAEAERRRLEGDAAPQSAADYDRLLLASPNSSFLWIKFMAYLLSLADPDAARAVAERALSTIHFREEGERLNVWVAFLNLEHAYGTPDPKEAVLKLFQRALSHADPKKLHFALLGIYERADQYDLVDHLLRTMTRKFSTCAKVWLRNIQSLLKRDMGKAVQKTLDRSLLSLPTRKHIKVISRTAIMEFKIGSAERGRTMMEGILRNYPKRTDLWSTYIDQEIRLGDSATVRALFERAICLDLPPKRMKFIFKRYLDYEKGMNDEQTIEAVKAKAMAYVETKMG